MRAELLASFVFLPFAALPESCSFTEGLGLAEAPSSDLCNDDDGVSLGFPLSVTPSLTLRSESSCSLLSFTVNFKIFDELSSALLLLEMTAE